MIIKKTFDELTKKELWQIAILRTHVFTIEQGFLEDELEEADYQAIHYFIKENDIVVAYARVIEVDGMPKLGRVVTEKVFRGQGYQTKIIKRILKDYDEIGVSSQMHVIDFYEKLGFSKIGQPYLEAGAKHQYLKFKKNNN